MQTFPFEASKKMQWVRVRGWKTEGNGVEGNLPLPFPHRSTPWMGSHLQCRLAHALFKSFSKVAQSKVIWGWHPSLYMHIHLLSTHPQHYCWCIVRTFHPVLAMSVAATRPSQPWSPSKGLVWVWCPRHCLTWHKSMNWTPASVV